MTTSAAFDAAVIGGGIMGCTVALHLARGGMRVAVFERKGLCTEASGTNGGSLTMQIKRASLVPYALRAREMWKNARSWLGEDMGFGERGGLTLAFSEAEAETLKKVMSERRAAGAPIEIIGPNRARELEPALSDKPVLASYCAIDSYADPTVTGRAYRAALLAAGVTVREGTPVTGLAYAGAGFAVRAADGETRVRRLVLAGGVWLPAMLGWLGVDLPIRCRVNQVAVTERLPTTFRLLIGVVNGLLTLKQARNGTVMMGGGWQGLGGPESGGWGVIPDNLIGNVRLARFVIPALGKARVVRSWCGLEAQAPGFEPVAGPLPGIPDATIIGCVRGGYTIAPLLGFLLAQRILGREPDLPLFDPARIVGKSFDTVLPSEKIKS